MDKIYAVIKGVGAYVPDYVLTNEELSQMVDTSDEWIMTRIGIKERRILKEDGKATSDLAVKAIENLLQKTNTDPQEIDFVLCATVTPDMQFPATANLITHKLGMKAFGFDMNAGCSGFLFALANASKWVESGAVKKMIVVGAEKMSSIVDYTDRAVCPIFGDGAGAVLLEPDTKGDVGIMDFQLYSNGDGWKNLHQKAGGSLKPPSHETVDAREHYIYQEGQAVYKHAVICMADVTKEICERNGLDNNSLDWLIPHQANKRIIDFVAQTLKLPAEKIMINIDHFGNTTAATLPLCMWEWEKKMKKGDNVILSVFGAGFTWGGMYLKWAYDTK
ncbi:MAG: ketoacyl-ACP synthase III [Bacteroidales bacterium]|jgi:3-oxoacyl-[acyl-carrier-protein] synthase-3|nr:ketoacyl-ACP synthase III [Bacteroidales bacterium]